MPSLKISFYFFIFNIFQLKDLLIHKIHYCLLNDKNFHGNEKQYFIIKNLLLMFIYIFVCIYSISKNKKYAQNIWSYDLVHEKTFRLSSRTPRVPLNVLSRTIILCLSLLLELPINIYNSNVIIYS